MTNAPVYKQENSALRIEPQHPSGSFVLVSVEPSPPFKKVQKVEIQNQNFYTFL